MGDGPDKAPAPGRGSTVETASGGADGGQQRPGVGKQTLTEQLPGAGSTIGAPPSEVAKKTPSITGVVVAGGPLSDADVDAIDKAAASVPKQFKHYVAYSDSIKVGGSLAWRANNPGNLRDASTKIGKVPGASGTFAVFATMEDGRAAQRDLYLSTYGAMTVRAAIEKLTPRNENDTDAYLKKLAAAGVDLDKDVKSQIDVLMPAVKNNEGMITGVVVARAAAAP
jgi:hypothetical protein